MLLTNQNGVRGPKNYNSNNLDKILDGCRNQAWDLSYVSSWSTVYYNEDKYDKIFFFATNEFQSNSLYLFCLNGFPFPMYYLRIYKIYKLRFTFQKERLKEYLH